jgi:ABC-type phosphate transport system substrate-binding protein
MKFSIKVAMATSVVLACACAQAEVVVIVNPKHPAASMTAEQVANVYLGKDASFAPADLPESASQRNEFYTKVAGKDSAQVKAIWARLVFTGKTQPPKEIGSSADAVKFVAGNDKAIAYVDKGAVDGSVKAVLTVN